MALTIRHVASPALPGAGGVHVGAVLGHRVCAALLAVAVLADQLLGDQIFYKDQIIDE